MGAGVIASAYLPALLQDTTENKKMKAKMIYRLICKDKRFWMIELDGNKIVAHPRKGRPLTIHVK